jgi:hypothetical protein
MFIADFLFVLMLALVFTSFFGHARSRHAPPPDWVWLFMVFLFATWALGAWLRPIGPPVGGVHWASFVAAIVVVSLLMLAAASSPRRKNREELKGVEIRPMTPAEEQIEEERAEAAAATSAGVAFWVLIAVALAALMVRYAFADIA